MSPLGRRKYKNKEDILGKRVKRKKGQWKKEKRTSRDTKEKEKIEGDGSHWSSFLMSILRWECF